MAREEVAVSESVISPFISVLGVLVRVITWSLCLPVACVLYLIQFIVKSDTIKKCLTFLWWWMFLVPHESTNSQAISAPLDQKIGDSPNVAPASNPPTVPQLVRQVRTLTGLTASNIGEISKSIFWQGRRDNCFAIALLIYLQKTHPKNFLMLLQQLYNNGELHFRSDGTEMRIAANLTGDFRRVPSDREPHEVLAATIMQRAQIAVTVMLQNDLAEFARMRKIRLSENFRETFSPKFQWRQNLGVSMFEQESADNQLHALQLDSDQINDFYDFIEKKYIESHGGHQVHTLHRVGKGGPLMDGRPFPVADKNYLVYTGAAVSQACAVFFGKEASRPIAVVDGKELREHAKRGDYDHAPRKLLEAILEIKHKYNLPAGAAVLAECAQYHAFTFIVPRFNSVEEIEAHLSADGHVVIGSTNWGPDMYINIAHDKAGKMIMYYGDEDGNISEDHAMGRCFFYSSNGRNVRFFDPEKIKFDLVDP
ncbi:MAG: hypothetical protein LBI34_00315 [Puniceicoccales bacterium]|jgi:hypothetical protein|nr:hypothetical protein [Puniceicoccales bacterium]